MAVFETWLKSDLKKPLNVQKLSGNLFSSDNGGNLIGVEILDNGSPATLTGGVTGYLIREDGATVTVTGTLSGNRASIVLPSSAYIVVGFLSIVIKVGTTTVGACTGYVYRTTTDLLVDPGHVIPSIEELLAQIENCRQATTNANTAASSANSAASNANTKASLADEKAGLANTAAGTANTAASAANTAASKIDGMTVAASGLAPGSSPTVTISEVSGHKHIAFGLVKGDKGDAGKDFHIAKTFASIAAMMAYTGTDIEAYDFAMIDTGSVEDPDTGKLYCYEPETQDKWQYIGDLSGAQGIKGDTGNGIDHVALNQDYTLTIYFTDGTSYTTTSIRGQSGNETIDDTAGIGDTDLVWSADKTQKELNAKADIIVVVDDMQEAVKTIPDGADNLPIALTVGIEPVQDLHGYDNPWPGGGGKNLIPDGTDTNNGYVAGNILRYDGLTQTVAGYYVSEYFAVQPSTNYVYSHNASEAPDAPAVCFYDENKQFISDSGTKIGRRAYVAVQSPSNAVYARTTQSETYIMQLETGTTPTGVSPYRNICPISGWTGCNVTRTGKNLYNKDGTDTSNGYEDGKILKSTGNAEAPGSPQYWCISEYIRVEPSTTYTISGMRNLSASGAVYCCQYDENNNFVQSVDQSFASITLTTGSNVKFVRLTIEKGQMATVQIEKGSVASAYESFGINAYSITFPSSAGTVYGATLTINRDGTGKLVVTKASAVMASLGWSTESRSTGWDTFKISRTTLGAEKSDDVISNVFHYGGENLWNLKYPTSYNNLYLSVPTLSSFNTTALAALLTEVNAQMVFVLATPQTYQLTASEIDSILTTGKGINNIFADTGDILSVDYSADTKMYVDAEDESKQEQIDSIHSMIAESDAVTATESHAIGDVFICNNQLIRATDTIATGETVVIGSNAEEITLAEYIAEVVESLGATKNDVSVLKSYPVPSDYFLLKKLGFIDFTAGSGSQGTLKMESNVLTFSGGSGTTYYHFNLLGSHRIKSGTWGNYTPLPEDFAPIDELFKLDNSSVKRRYCLNTNGNIITGTGSGSTMRALLMKDNGDGTYTYKYTGLWTICGNIPLRSESMDIADWDGIAIVFTSTARPINTTVYFSIEEGEGGEYTWLDK